MFLDFYYTISTYSFLTVLDMYALKAFGFSYLLGQHVLLSLLFDPMSFMKYSLLTIKFITFILN